jgi:hypothetical protein
MFATISSALRARFPILRNPRHAGQGTGSASPRAWRTWGGVIAALLAMMVPGLAWSNSTDYNAFNTKYGTTGTRIDAAANCTVCHTSVPTLNSYGSAYKTAVVALGGRSAVNSPIAFGNIESQDSDSDGSTNLAEITARFFPGDANDHPAAAATVPGAPTGVSATAGNAQASVSFTAPSSNGGSAITGYTVTSSPGGVTATGTASPITITGMVNGTAYTFTVKATNAVGSSAASSASNSVTPAAVTGNTVDVRSYIPAGVAASGYQGFIRVINTGTTATPVTIAGISGASGALTATGQLIASLPAGAATTFSAQDVEAVIGPATPSARPRIRVASSASTIEVQSFMANPGGIITQVSDALTASTGYAVRSYVPAANASAGYTSFIRVINVSTTAASPISVTLIDDTTGVTGVTGQLIASLPANAAITFSAQEVEAALGVSISASKRPRILVASTSTPAVPLEVQSFIANPGGAVTQIGGASSGAAITVRSYIPAANAASGYSGFVRVINTGTAATAITVCLRDGDTGVVGACDKQLVASLPAGAATTFSASQIETALGVALPASARPRIVVSATATGATIDVQSFMSNPGGTVTQLSGAQTGTSVNLRTYIPAANSSAGYTSLIRVINIGSTATPVSVAVINATTGVVGTSGQLSASIPAGAAVTFTAQQVEAALGVPQAASDRHRIRVTASTNIEVQSFMANPGGVITETVDFQQ